MIWTDIFNLDWYNNNFTALIIMFIIAYIIMEIIFIFKAKDCFTEKDELLINILYFKFFVTLVIAGFWMLLIIIIKYAIVIFIIIAIIGGIILLVWLNYAYAKHQIEQKKKLIKKRGRKK